MAQSKSLKSPCAFTSQAPCVPSLFGTAFRSNLRMKSPASGVKIFGVGNFPRRILSLVAALPWFEWKGDLPVRRSNVKMPNDHQSAGLPYPLLLSITSGAIYSTVKQNFRITFFLIWMVW